MNKTIYKDGVHEISNSEYHNSAGISRSMLMEMKISPRHYWYKYVSGLYEKESATPDMDLGNAVHTLVLEESKFDDEFYIITQEKRPAKNTKAYIEMIESSSGKTILTNDQYIQAIKMAQSVKSDNDISQLLDGCVVERSIYFTHKSTGLQVKARPDAWSGSLVLDLKTTADAREKPFKTSCMSYGYFIQAAIVNEAMKSINAPMDNFVFITVEKKAPFCVGAYVVDQEGLDYGKKQFDALMENLARCLDSNKWPGYGIRDISPPSYAQYDEILEIENE